MELSLVSNFLRANIGNCWKFKGLKIPSSQLKIIQNELLDLPINFFHNQVTQKHKGWTQLVLRGIDAHSNGHFTKYGFKKSSDVNWRWIKKNCDLVPNLMNLLNEQYNDLSIQRVVISRLGPYGLIRPHKDDFSGMHISMTSALIWPKGCILEVDNKKILISEGEVFHINYQKQHSVANTSHQPRFALSVMGIPLQQQKYINNYLGRNNLIKS